MDAGENPDRRGVEGRFVSALPLSVGLALHRRRGTRRLTRRLPFLAALIVVIGGLVALAACGERSDVRDTNLLVITVDTLRADRLGAYGYESIETPHIDRLAREGSSPGR